MPKASTLATSSPATVTALRDVLGVQDVLGTVNIFDDTTAGLAATSDGDYFSVPSAEDDEYLILYKNETGSATEIKRYPSGEYITTKASEAASSALSASDSAAAAAASAESFDAFMGLETQTSAVEGAAAILPSKPAGYKRIVIGGVTYVFPYYHFGSMRAIATRGVVPNRKHATNTQTMAQTRHFARDAVSTVKLVYSNWAAVVSGGIIVEQGSGGDMTVTASVSKDRVTWTPVTFGGNSSATVADGENVESDSVAIDLAAGDEFFVRTWKSHSGSGRAVYSINYCDASANEMFRLGTSVPDCTDGTAFTGTANEYFAGPTAILGMSAQPSILLVGDSITYGFDDDYTPNPDGDLGKLAPSIGAELGYIMAGVSSDSAYSFVASGSKRAALHQYATHVIGAHGRNDLDANRTDAQIKADIEAIVGMMGGKPVWWDTIAPRSSSTDAWATVENQTVASSNATRAIVNDWLRAKPDFLAGCFDSCQAIENDHGNNDGKWKVGLTDDGQHPNPDGYAAVKTAGVIDTAGFA